MRNLLDFMKAAQEASPTVSDRALAVLWYQAQIENNAERTPSELAAALHELGYARPHATKLRDALRKSGLVVRGVRTGAYRIDAGKAHVLAERLGPFLGAQKSEILGAFVDPEVYTGTRRYIESICNQVNGTYERGFYDASAVMGRRILESLAIEVYVAAGRENEVRPGSDFLGFDGLISHLAKERGLGVSRSLPGDLTKIKIVGDTCAHHRTFVASRHDLDEIRLPFRRALQELLQLAKIR